MDPDILQFAQVVGIIVPAIAALTGVGVLAHWIVERTNRMSQRPPEKLDEARLDRLEHAIDAIAMEVERLGEGQRFVTKLLVAHTPEASAPELPAKRGQVITPH